MKSVKHSCSVHGLTAIFLLAIGGLISKDVAAEVSVFAALDAEKLLADEMFDLMRRQQQATIFAG